jgi:ABC-2 type transport system permease protein
MTVITHAVAPLTIHPAAGIPFTRLLRVEWRKSIDTRAAQWLLISTVVLSIVAVAVPLVRAADLAQTLPDYAATVSYAVTLLVPVISILTLTSEWTQRTVLSTFTHEPRRGRVLAAKLCAGFGLATIGGAIGFLVAAGGLQLSYALGRGVSWDISTKELVGYALFVLLSSVMGMAFGAALHNTAGAIVLYFALPTLMMIAGMALRSLRDWIDTATTFIWILRGDWSGHSAQIATSVAIWVVLPLAVGLVRTMRREVR